MKKILIIRSANMQILEKLICYIKKKYPDKQKYQLYILIQKECIQDFCNKYKEIICIEKEDGFFSYSKFKNNKELTSKLKKLNFNEVYIPSSNINFDQFYETFLIASQIKTDKHILVNCNLKVKEVKLKAQKMIFMKEIKKFTYIFKIVIALILIIFAYLIYYPWSKLKQIYFKFDSNYKL